MATTTTPDEKILDRVAKLLALAEHPNTPAPEAEIALLQANKLIAKHAIDEAILRQSQTVGQRRALTERKVVIGGGTFNGTLRTILSYAADANRVSVAFLVGGTAHLFGAEEDVAWVEMLYSMIHLQFLSKINPTWDTAKTWDENVYNFKVAGFKWLDINAESIKHGGPDTRIWEESQGYLEENPMGFEPRYEKEFRNVVVTRKSEHSFSTFGTWERPTNKMTARLKAAYKRWAANVGDDSPVTTQSHQAYRRSYADAFSATMSRRFLKMKADAQAEMDTIPGAALAIRDMKDEADQAMWDMYPDISPAARAARQKAMYEQQQREDAEYQAKLDAMTPKQREEFLEREERKRRRQDEAYWRRVDRAPRADQGARRRGESVANSIDLTRKAGRADAGATRGEIG